MDLKLNGVFLTTRAVVRRMLAAGYGRIINISSIAGKTGQYFNPISDFLTGFDQADFPFVSDLYLNQFKLPHAAHRFFRDNNDFRFLNRYQKFSEHARKNAVNPRQRRFD